MKLSNQMVVAAVIGIAFSLIAGYGLAQGKPAAPEKKPAAQSAASADAGPSQACPHDECKHGGMHCPMSALSALAEVKVEKTKTGASLQITAKDQGKLSEVHALAEKIAEHIKTGECPMMKGDQAHPHGHHHGHPPAK
jgi:hypothetical protein